jgi:hypothetical protein
MRIRFHKLTGERHLLEIVRADGRRDEVACETRSTLVHDLLHYAVEAEAGLAGGFWGNLAAGKTFADMNDRSGKAMAGAAPEMALVEQMVGALSGAAKGRAASEMVAGLARYTASLGTTLPAWLTVDFVIAVQERMRRLIGHWRATGHGAAMELDWPPSPVASVVAQARS